MTRGSKLLWIMAIVTLGLIAALVWDHFDRTRLPDNNELVQFFQDTVIMRSDGRLAAISRWQPPITEKTILVGSVKSDFDTSGILDLRSLDGAVNDMIVDLSFLTGLAFRQSADQDGDITIRLSDSTGGPAFSNSLIIKNHHIVRSEITVRTGDLVQKHRVNCETERDDCVTTDDMHHTIRGRIARGLARTLGMRGVAHAGRSILRNDDTLSARDAIALYTLYDPALPPGTSPTAAIEFVSDNADSIRTSQRVADFLSGNVPDKQ